MIPGTLYDFPWNDSNLVELCLYSGYHTIVYYWHSGDIIKFKDVERISIAMRDILA